MKALCSKRRCGALARATPGRIIFGDPQFWFLRFSPEAIIGIVVQGLMGFERSRRWVERRVRHRRQFHDTTARHTDPGKNP